MSLDAKIKNDLRNEIAELQSENAKLVHAIGEHVAVRIQYYAENKELRAACSRAAHAIYQVLNSWNILARTVDNPAMGALADSLQELNALADRPRPAQPSEK